MENKTTRIAVHLIYQTKQSMQTTYTSSTIPKNTIEMSELIPPVFMKKNFIS